MIGSVTTRQYLFDTQNHTGYAQVLEEYVNDQLNRTYTLGHDVIAQNDSANGTLTFMYDGHGSTRALLDAAAALAQAFAYDAYGNHLAAAGLTSSVDAMTNLLYSGEWTLPTGLQYLRARYYNPGTGRFNRLDPFAGNQNDPQSLHKYLYTHANPVMGIDPSGNLFTLADVLTGVKLMSIITATGSLAGKVAFHVTGGSFWKGAGLGAVAGAAVGWTIAFRRTRVVPVIKEGLIGGAMNVGAGWFQGWLSDASGRTSSFVWQQAFLEGFAWGSAAEAWGGELLDHFGWDDDDRIVTEAIIAAFTAAGTNLLDVIGGGARWRGQPTSRVVSDILFDSAKAALITMYMNGHTNPAVRDAIRNDTALRVYFSSAGVAVGGVINNLRESFGEWVSHS
jgi:RHS repeat-associated protein